MRASFEVIGLLKKGQSKVLQFPAHQFHFKTLLYLLIIHAIKHANHRWWRVEATPQSAEGTKPQNDNLPKLS